MKFRVARDEFADSVAWVARSLPSRPPVPVLGCVVLDVDNGLTVSGFDYEVSAQESIAAEVAEPGKVLVSGRLLAEITKALPNKPVDVTLDGCWWQFLPRSSTRPFSRRPGSSGPHYCLRSR